MIFLVPVLTMVLGIGFFSFASAQDESQIPAWVKTAIGFWINGEITDDEFIHAVEYFVQNEIIQIPSQTDDDQLLIENLQALQVEINMKIEQSRDIINLSQIQSALIESNAQFANTGYPEELIRQADEMWQSSDPDVPDSVAFHMIHNPSADILRSIMSADQKSESQFKYAEIFITNQYGGNVAQSHKTSDFRQDDEIWWQKAEQNGIFLSEGGYDESAGVYASDIALKILDENGNFIGILKAVINIESLTESSQVT